MPNLGRAPRFCAWVLRCREVPGAETPAWRFSLEDPRTTERHGFASLAGTGGARPDSRNRPTV